MWEEVVPIPSLHVIEAARRSQIPSLQIQGTHLSVCVYIYIITSPEFNYDNGKLNLVVALSEAL